VLSYHKRRGKSQKRMSIVAVAVFSGGDLGVWAAYGESNPAKREGGGDPLEGKRRFFWGESCGKFHQRRGVLRIQLKFCKGRPTSGAGI